MSATYDTSLGTNLDWVRFLTGDTDTASPKLSDEEITALISEQTSSGDALKYYAAAAALGALLAKWSASGLSDGLIRKEVDELTVEFGSDTSARAAVEARISWLRREGSRRLSSRPFSFKVY